MEISTSKLKQLLPIYTDSSELMDCLCNSQLLQELSTFCTKISGSEFVISDEVYSRLMVVALCDEKYSDDEIRNNILQELANIPPDFRAVIVVSTFDCHAHKVPWVKVADIQSAYEAIESIISLINSRGPAPIDYNDVQNRLIFPPERIGIYTEDLERFEVPDIERVLSVITNNGENVPKTIIIQLLFNNNRKTIDKIINNIWDCIEPYPETLVHTCFSRIPQIKPDTVRINLFYR